MAAASSPTPLTLSALATYILLAGLLVASVVASYVLKIFPDAIGQLGAGTSLVAAFVFLAHEFGGETTPSALPKWTSFIVLTLASVAEGALGQFTGATLLTVGAFVTWLTLFGGLLYHAIATDAGQNLPTNAEAWITSGIGVGVAIAVYYLDNPMGGVAAFIAAAIPIVTMYFHVGAGTIVPVLNPPAPPAPTVA